MNPGLTHGCCFEYTMIDFVTRAWSTIGQRLEAAWLISCARSLFINVWCQNAWCSSHQAGYAVPVQTHCGKHHHTFSGRMPPGWSASQVEGCSYCIAGLWSLDDLKDPQTKKVLQEVRAQPDHFVLKPQREGGGNNLYGQAILDRLQDTKGLAAFILMQRIRPPINRFAHPHVARSDRPCHCGKRYKAQHHSAKSDLPCQCGKR